MIKILPARLANQIAAGEVVERPASVVKELVENSLDSGATRIDIDIDKGGSKLIRVRDNGCGIAKDELALALSRHATSKIHTLDDLEVIMSLGFRGEALASISAVSRLTLTSRTATQEEAWSAYSEGRDMEVKLQPTAHPIGSTVEVLDLFFNTPARRKFLRTEKTEFSHIDELLKRIALSRFDVAINLKHNGKLIRQYRTAKTDVQIEKRIAAVCGANFVRHMLKIELEHNGLRLHGWVTSPDGARQQNDLQYCYVNGRMMRDKLINHAIRQSYETSLRSDQFASYVLFIELEPSQVDVNVHPAKHEVRFHQARLVHDFIYQALADALAQANYVESPKSTLSAYHTEKSETEQHKVMEAIQNTPAYPGRSDYTYGATSEPTSQSFENRNPKQVTESHHDKAVSQKKHDKPLGTSVTKKELQAYQALLSTPVDAPHKVSASTSGDSSLSDVSSSTVLTPSVDMPIKSIGKVISVVQHQYLLTLSDVGAVIISLAKAEWYRVCGQLQVSKHKLTPQPLLVPLSIKLDKASVSACHQYKDVLEQFAIQLKEKNSTNIIVMSVPQPLRQQNLQQVIPDLLSYLLIQGSVISPTDITTWLTTHITQVKSDYTLSESIQLISELEQLWDGKLPLHDPMFVQPVNFNPTISRFT